MPGYDRTGPRGSGSQTGWGMGRCGRPTERTRPVEDADRDDDTGWYGRRQGGGGGGGGRRRGFGMGRRAQGAAGGDVEPGRQQSFLRRRIEELTEELDRIKQLFAKDDREGAED